MKKKRSALLAVILAIAMLITMVPTVAYAADPNPNQIGTHQMVNPGTGELTGNGTMTANTSADGMVTVNKTIEQTAENKFKITLNVITKTEFDTTTVSEDAAVVLAIDTSGSMEGSRLREAKKAAQSFINSFASDTAAVRKVAIVEFGSTVKGEEPTWKDANDLKTADANTLCEDLKGLRADGGTNMDAAFQVAKTELEKLKTDPNINIKNLNVVLLTDGEPTFYGLNGTDSYGNCSSHKTHMETEKSAKALRDAGYNIYAVYVGNEELVCHQSTLLGIEPNPDCYLNQKEDYWFFGWKTRVVGGTKVDKWLQNHCGFTTFAVSNLADLTKTFQDIATQIELSAKAGVVTDPMGALIRFDGNVMTDDNADDPSWSFAGNTLTWDLKKANYTWQKVGNTEDYVYELSYNITLNTLDQNFAAGKDYPTNGTTSMTYTVTVSDVPTLGNIYFNIPTVKGFAGSYAFTKLDKATNNPLEGVKFTLTTRDDPNWSKAVYSGANGKVEINNLPSGHDYMLKETEALPGYEEGSGSYGVTVNFGVAASAALNNVNNTVYNKTKTYSSLNVEKIWNDNDNNDGKRPDSVTVGLYEVGENGDAVGEPVQTITIRDDGQGNWIGQFTDVPMARDGQLINYTVQEITVPAGYTAAVELVHNADEQLTGFKVTNTYGGNEQTTLTVTKTWKDNSNSAGKRPDAIRVDIFANGEMVESIQLTAENGWKAEMQMDKYLNGQQIVYTVKENGVPEGYTVEYDQSTLTITNTYKTEPAPTPNPNPNVPETGGTGSAMLWSMLMLAAAAMLIGSVLLRKKLNA